VRELPGGRAPRLRPPWDRLFPGPHRRLPGRRAFEVPAPPHGPEVVRQGANRDDLIRHAPMELFLNPWSMIAGGALISSPIIIHLINRMRFNRIRWAAMELLLKSQKRNSRRLIIEQLILLLLRIMLVLLAGLLLARLLAGGFVQQQSTLHVVILDDTPSMSDHWREEGETKDTFDFAKQSILNRIAKNA